MPTTTHSFFARHPVWGRATSRFSTHRWATFEEAETWIREHGNASDGNSYSVEEETITLYEPTKYNPTKKEEDAIEELEPGVYVVRDIQSVFNGKLPKPSEDESSRDNNNAVAKLEVLLEAARRANWDALKGPPHLRTGRFRPMATKR